MKNKAAVLDVILLLTLTFLTGCSTLNRTLTDGGRRDPLNTEKIAVISTFGDEFSVFCMGTTIWNGRDFDHHLTDGALSSEFGTKACSVLSEMGYDAVLQQGLRSSIKTKKAMMAVGGERDVVDFLLPELSKRGYTAVLLISDWRSDYYDGARSSTGALNNMGLVSSSIFSLGRRSDLYASIEMHLYDVNDAENFRVVREFKQKDIDLQGDWPKSFEAIPPGKRAEYLQIIKQLVDDELGNMVEDVVSKI